MLIEENKTMSGMNLHLPTWDEGDSADSIDWGHWLADPPVSSLAWQMQRGLSSDIMTRQPWLLLCD
jgi:hypothetical protein